METESFKKIITVNDESYETISKSVAKLIFFMFKENENQHVEYFKLRLKDSEKNPFAKDLLLEWVCPKQPERSKREDQNKLFQYPEGTNHISLNLDTGMTSYGCGTLNTMET